jgi:hypothetical protein
MRRSQRRRLPAAVSKRNATRKYFYVCWHGGCTKKARGRDGLCVSHGAKVITCSFKGCTNNALSKGVCKRHGAEVAARRRCNHEGCNNEARKGGVCRRHGANTTPTTAVEGNRYKFVKLRPGISRDLTTEAMGAIQGDGESIVTIEGDDVFRGLLPEHKEKLTKRTDGSYTDNHRKQYPFQCPNNLMDFMQTTLQREVKGGSSNVLKRGNVLETGDSGLRQQAHWDFSEILRRSRSRFFVIIPVDSNQSIFVSDEGGKLSRVRLRKDWAFVGHGDLLHCGSETPGRRVHFEFVPQQDENNSEVYTFWGPDPTYPHK